MLGKTENDLSFLCCNFSYLQCNSALHNLTVSLACGVVLGEKQKVILETGRGRSVLSLFDCFNYSRFLFFFFYLFPVEVNILISLLDRTICGDLVSLPSLCFQTLCSIISVSFLLEFVWLLLTPENSLIPSQDNSIKLF